MLLLSKADIKKVFTMKDAVEVFFLCRLMWRKWTQRL